MKLKLQYILIIFFCKKYCLQECIEIDKDYSPLQESDLPISHLEAKNQKKYHS